MNNIYIIIVNIMRDYHNKSWHSTTLKCRAFDLYEIEYSRSKSGRSIIIERINAGLARARSNRTRLGRLRVDESVELAIRQALGRGDKGILQIAGADGGGMSVVQPSPTISGTMANSSPFRRARYQGRRADLEIAEHERYDLTRLDWNVNFASYPLRVLVI